MNAVSKETQDRIITDALRWVAQEAKAAVMGGPLALDLPKGSRLREALKALDEAYHRTTTD